MIFDTIFNDANPIEIDEKHPQEIWCGVQGIENHASIQDTIQKQMGDVISWYQANQIEIQDGPELQCETGFTEGGIGIDWGTLDMTAAGIISQTVVGYSSFRVDQYPYGDQEYRNYLSRKGELERDIENIQNEIQYNEELVQECTRQMLIEKDTALSFDPMIEYDFLECFPYAHIDLDDLGAFVGEWFDFIFKDESPYWELRGYVYKHSTTKLDNYMNPSKDEEEQIVQIQNDLDENWEGVTSAFQSLQDISDRIQNEESQLEEEYERLERETDPEQREVIEENIRRIEAQLVVDRERRTQLQGEYDEQKNNYAKPYDDFKESTGEQYDHRREAQPTFFKPVGTLKVKVNITSPYQFDEETWFIYKNMLNGEGQIVDPENWDYNAQAFVQEFQEYEQLYAEQVGMWEQNFYERQFAMNRLEVLYEDLRVKKDELEQLKDPKRKVEIADISCGFIDGGVFTLKGMLALGSTVTIRGKARYEVLSGNGWEHPNEYEVGIDEPSFDNNKYVKYVLDDTLYRTITLNESVKDKVFST